MEPPRPLALLQRVPSSITQPSTASPSPSASSTRSRGRARGAPSSSTAHPSVPTSRACLTRRPVASQARCRCRRRRGRVPDALDLVAVGGPAGGGRGGDQSWRRCSSAGSGTAWPPSGNGPGPPTPWPELPADSTGPPGGPVLAVGTAGSCCSRRPLLEVENASDPPGGRRPGPGGQVAEAPEVAWRSHRPTPAP